MNAKHSPRSILAASFALLSLAACSHEPETVPASRFVQPDKLFQVIESNVRNHPGFEVIVDIDHARLAEKAGSPMPPSHVLIWSDPELDAAILKASPLAAVDLPLPILAFEDQVVTGKAAVIANRFDFLVNRHGLPGDAVLRERYTTAIATAMQGIGAESIAAFATEIPYRMRGW